MRLLGALLTLAATCPAAEFDALPDVAVIDEHAWTMAASRRRQRLETAPQPVTVISGNELNDTPATSIADRLRYVPGVDVYQARNGQYDIGLRGWNGAVNNRVLVLVDGDPFRQEEFGLVHWTGALFQSDIERIELVKGPASPSYGANAFGGAIAIIGRRPGERQRIDAITTASDQRSWDGDATASGPLDERFYYKIAVGGTRVGDLPANTNPAPAQPHPRLAVNDDLDTVAVRYKAVLGVRLPAESRAEIDYTAAELSRWDFIDDVDAGVNDTDCRYHDLGARFAHPWVQARVVLHQSVKRYSNMHLAYVPAEDFRFTQAEFDDRASTVRVQVTPPLPDHQPLLGVERRAWSSRSNLWSRDGRFTDPDTWATVRTDTLALIAEDQWRAQRWLSLTAGVRGDDHDLTGRHWSPRGAINLIPDDDQFILLSFSSGYRLPTPIESYISEFYFRSSSSLSPESIRAFELAWQRRLMAGDLRVGANAFASRADDLIWAMPLPAAQMQASYMSWLGAYSGGDTSRPPGPLLEFRNLDNPVTTLGGEATAQLHVPDSAWTLWSNATLQRQTYRDPIIYAADGFTDPLSGATIFRFHRDLGREINGPPPAKANLGLRWGDQGPFAGVALRLVSGREVFSLGHSELTGGKVAVQHIPGYAAGDLTAGWRFRPGTVLRVAIMDVTDSSHHEWYDTSTDQLVRYNEQQGGSEIGRRIAVQGQFGW